MTGLRWADELLLLESVRTVNRLQDIMEIRVRVEIHYGATYSQTLAQRRGEYSIVIRKDASEDLWDAFKNITNEELMTQLKDHFGDLRDKYQAYQDKKSTYSDDESEWEPEKTEYEDKREALTGIVSDQLLNRVEDEQPSLSEETI